MLRQLVVPVVVFVAVVMAAPVARGHWLNAVGRYLGVGWSDGYHSRTACPPKPGAILPPAGPAPWWTVPAESPEPLPHPATQRPLSHGLDSATGPSLFRQPGEGATSKPSPAAAP
jgi:hypothetical protein